MRLFPAFKLCALLICAQVKALTLSQAVEQFVSNSEEITAAKSERQEVHFRFKEAKSSFFPSLDLKAGYNSQKSVFYLGDQTINSDTSLYSTNLEISQPIYLGGKIWSAYKFRKVQKDISEYEFKDKKNKAVGSFIEVAAHWMSLREQMHELNKSLSIQKQLVTITRKNKSRGAVSSFEWDQVQADFEALKFRYEQLSMYFKSVDRQLRQLMAVDKDTELSLQWNTFKDPIVGGDGSGWVEKAKEHRPDWKLGEAGVEFSKIEKSLDLADDKPSVAVFGAYGYQGTEISQLGDTDSQVHSYGVSVTIPIFSGLSSLHRSRAGTAKIFASQKRKELLEKVIKTDISNKLEMYKSSFRQLKLAQGWADKSQSALRRAVQTFRIGRLSITQMSQLQSANERAAGSLAEAKKAFFLAERDWNLALGKDLVDYYRGL